MKKITEIKYRNIQENTTILINGEKIPYRIILSRRKTTCIAVHPDRSVIVRAPLKADRTALENWVQGRIPWIAKHIQTFKEKEVLRPKNNSKNGDFYFYLGKKMDLKIQKSNENSVIFHEDTILIHSRQIEQEYIKKLLMNALRKEADIMFAKRLKICFLQTKKYSLTFPNLRIRRMKSRWGSCSVSRGITLNIHLMHLPVKLIDHVILHELCHLRVQNHGSEFYKMLSGIEPDWRSSKDRINQFAPLVLPH